jgi:hypothetical protein
MPRSLGRKLFNGKIKVPYAKLTTCRGFTEVVELSLRYGDISC